jgi:hypothetical protein
LSQNVRNEWANLIAASRLWGRLRGRSGNAFFRWRWNLLWLRRRESKSAQSGFDGPIGDALDFVSEVPCDLKDDSWPRDNGQDFNERGERPRENGRNFNKRIEFFV